MEQVNQGSQTPLLISSTGAPALIPTSNYLEEIKTLLSLFEQENFTTIKGFRDIWKTLNFSHAHQGFKGDRVDYLHSLYYTFIGYLFVPNPSPSLKYGVLYGLYLLFNTQLNEPKVKIIVSLSLWQALLVVDQEARSTKNADSYHVLKKMISDGAFLFSAALHPASFRTYIPSHGPVGINTANSGANTTASTPLNSSNPGNAIADEFDGHIVRSNSSASIVVQGGIGLNVPQDNLRGVIDVDRIDRLAKAYYVAKTQPGSVSDASRIDLSQLPIPPPSLNFVHANLGDDLRSILSELEERRARTHAIAPLTAVTNINSSNNNNINISGSNTNNPISRAQTSPVASRPTHHQTSPPPNSTSPSTANTAPRVRKRNTATLIPVMPTTTTTTTTPYADDNGYTPTSSSSTRRGRRRRIIRDDDEAEGEEGNSEKAKKIRGKKKAIE